MPKRRMTIRSLLDVVQVSSGSVEYASQTGQATNATTVAEGAAKPESDMTFELKTVSTRTVANFVKVSTQILDDVPMIRDTIDTELRYGLALAEEGQILSGDGVAPNVEGLITGATAYSNAGLAQLATNPTIIDTVADAILQCALSDFTPSGVVVHPSDWWRIRLTKDSDGN